MRRIVCKCTERPDISAERDAQRDMLDQFRGLIDAHRDLIDQLRGLVDEHRDLRDHLRGLIDAQTDLIQ